jgi:hypothetical protein
MSHRSAVPIFTVIVLLAALGPRGLEAGGGCIPGTYLVEQDDGTQSLWTLSADGTLHITSSAEEALGFSHEQGIWESRGSRRAEAVTLDFNFAFAGPTVFPPAAVARVDARLAFSKKCTSMNGTFELRFFDVDIEDPLDPSTDLEDSIPGTFTGRRLTLDRNPVAP